MSASARRDLLGRAAGRRAGAARSAGRSRCRPSGPRARRRRRRARTPSTRRRCRRPGTAAPGRRCRGRRPPRPARRWRPRKESSASSRPVIDVRAAAERGQHHVLEVLRGWRRRGSRSWRPSAPPSAPRSRAWSAYSASTCRVRSIASGASRPVASTPCAQPHDLHAAQQVGVRPGRRDVGDQQADGVGAAVDRGDPVTAPGLSARARRADASRESPSGPAARRAGSPPLPHALDRAVTDRVDPGPAASACPASACRHLTRSGIPPAVLRVGSTSRSSRVAR